MSPDFIRLSSFLSGGYYPPLSERLFGRIVRLDRLRHNRASCVTALVVGRLGGDRPRHVAARHRHHRP